MLNTIYKYLNDNCKTFIKDYESINNFFYVNLFKLL